MSLGVLRRGWPVVIEVTATMPGPPGLVWDLITDWEHQDDWMLEASDFEVISEQREGVGVEAEATVAIGGIKTRDRVRVSGWEPPKRLVIDHLGWVKGHGELHLTPGHRSPTTHLYWREELHPPLGILGAIGLALFKPLMNRVFARDLRVLQGLVRVGAGAP